MRSNMVHQFSQVPSAKIPRSVFNRSCSRKSTFDADILVPFYRDFAMPGDTFKCNTKMFIRIASPLSTPIMDNMIVDVFFFAAPIRLLWDNFEKFMGAQDDPGDSTDYTIPVMASDASGYDNQSLHDYLGLPTKVAASYNHSSLWHRAYQLIHNEWFRDQNLTDSAVVDKDDGPDSYTDYSLRSRKKRHDYFTSCLPWPQKGGDIDLPLGTSADVHTAADIAGAVGVYSDAQADWQLLSSAGSQLVISGGQTGAEANKYYADLSTATAATINELRLAFQMQKLLERDARGGTRYVEIIKSHFNVVSPDFRLQRPEYLGGGSFPLQVSPIAQNSETSTTPQGTLTAIGTAYGERIGYVKSFTEHCVLLGIVNVRADLTYQQGLPREFSWSTRYDLYWPALAHIGEQAVLSKEIYVDGSANDEDVFGYQERYAELRYKPSEITGQFRSNDTNTLDSWTLSQEFTVRPTLNNAFITSATPMQRVKSVDTNVPDFLMDAFLDIRCARPMPLFGTPGLLDHF